MYHIYDEKLTKELNFQLFSAILFINEYFSGGLMEFFILDFEGHSKDSL